MWILRLFQKLPSHEPAYHPRFTDAESEARYGVRNQKALSIVGTFETADPSQHGVLVKFDGDTDPVRVVMQMGGTATTR